MLAEAVNQVNDEITKTRDGLSQLDAKLAALEAFSIRLQKVIPGALMALALILTLIFAYVIFTQVEVIRLYMVRWQLLDQPKEVVPDKALAQPTQEDIGALEGDDQV